MQLRLVDSPTPEPARRRPDAIGRPVGSSRAARASTAKGQATKSAAKRTAKGRAVRGSVKGARGRAVHWADWHLDARTRRVGRAGVAAARAALEQAARTGSLPKAS